MLKRLALKILFRLRRFMQEEIIAQNRVLHGELDRLRGGLEGLHGELGRLGAEHEWLSVTLGQLHAEQEQLRLTLDGLRGEHEGLRATLNRLDLFDQTARTVEDGLLSLALLRGQEGQPQSREADHP